MVILDEADYLNPQSFQPALRGFIEEFANNCRFILTCNFKNRIIEPLHSRCGVYEFNTNKKTMAELSAQFMKRLTWILDQENVTYDKKFLLNLLFVLRLIGVGLLMSVSATLCLVLLTLVFLAFSPIILLMTSLDILRLRTSRR